MKTPTRALLAAVALVFAVSVPAQEKVTLSIATGPTTGVYYPLGGGIANILSKYVPGYAANAESTAGSVANLQLMSQKKSDLALSMADAAWDGFKGQGKFAAGAVPIRTLMIAYPEPDAHSDRRRDGYQQDCRFERQARFDRRTEQRHRIDGGTRSRSGGARPGKGHPA